MLDENDLKILELLKQDSKLSTYKISRKTLVPATTVHNRLKKLIKEGIIKRYTIEVDQSKLGFALTAYILMHYEIMQWGRKITRDEFRKKLLELPGVEEIAYLSGRFDILMKVRLRSIEELNNLILDRLRRIPGIGGSETLFVLEQIK